MIHTLFVYGTLKRAYGNNALLAGATFLGEATSLKASFVMWSGGCPYLALAPWGRGYYVRGELYEVDDATLARCDRLEQHPAWYERKQQAFKHTSGELINAWVYLQPAERVPPVENLDEPIDGVLEWKFQPYFEEEFDER